MPKQHNIDYFLRSLQWAWAGPLMQRNATFYAVGLLGALFIISQVLVLREFLLVSVGNELSIGLVLGNWFLVEALGSWWAGRRAGVCRYPLRGFILRQVILSLLLPLTLVAILTSRYLPGVSPWEALSLVQVGLLSLLLLSPLAFGNGAAFVYGCLLVSRTGIPSARASGIVYSLESAGAFLGGLVFTFVLVTLLPPVGTAFVLGFLNMTAALLLLFTTTAGGDSPHSSPEPAGAELGRGPILWMPSRIKGLSRRVLGELALLRIGVLLLGAFFLTALLSNFAERIQGWAVQVRWSPLKVVRSTESRYGNITVLQLDGEHVIYLNGVPSIFLPYPDITSIEELVHLPLLSHPDPKEVLLLGGGVGGLLAEIQKHPLHRVVYTELDPLLIRVVEGTRPAEIRAELTEPRTEVIYEDGRFYLGAAVELFDVILCHLPDPSTLQLNRFFTREFFTLVYRHLRPDGVFALTMPGSSSYLSDELGRLNRCVRETLKEVFPQVRVIPGERNLFLASGGAELEVVNAELLESRRQARGIQTLAVGPGHLKYKLDPERERWLDRELGAAGPIRLNEDLSPALLSYFLSWKNAEIQPLLRNPGFYLHQIPAGVLLLALGLLILPVVIAVACRKDRLRPALSFSIFGSGFAGMAVELSVILTFQSVYGYVYQWIGLLIATFMAGLGWGSWIASKDSFLMKSRCRFFCLLECGLTGLLLISALLLPRMQQAFLDEAGTASLPKLLLVGMNLVAGLIVGSEFPLATREYASGGAVSGAGRLYALDLAGAWWGTFTVSLLLVPLVGIGSALTTAAGLKALNLACLALGLTDRRRPSG